MRRRLLIPIICLTALLAAGQTLSAAAPVTDSAKAKKCKKKGAKAAAAAKPKKCKKKGAKGPSVALVEASIAAVAKEGYAPAGGGPEDVEVIFDRPTVVGKQVTWDSDGNPTNGSAGEIDAWPVKAWVTILSHRPGGPTDTYYGGCNGHLSESWPHDTLHMFYRGADGSWEWRGSNAGPGDC